MFLDPVIRAIRAPIDFVRSKVFGVKNIKGGIKGDVVRVKDQFKQAGHDAKELAGAAGDVNKAKGKRKKKKVKMGLFSKKKDCPSCGEKLHASWDQCPYCNYSYKAGGAPKAAPVAAPMPSGGGRQRTVALNVGGPGAAPSGPQLGWLVPLEGAQTGELFPLKGRVVVGSAPGCDVLINDSSISGRHAELVSGNSGFSITDLGSTNGTFVNDERVSSTDLVDNDNVRLGRINFKFKSMS
jgi:hypothetical protein